MSLSTLQFDDYDLERFTEVAARFGSDTYGFVVTPNADHLIRLDEDESFRALYADSAFTLLDSRFVARLISAARGIRLPVCPGSDLTARLFQNVIKPDDPLVLIGGAPQQADMLRNKYSLTRLAHYNPPMGFIRDAQAVNDCLEFVEAHSPFRFCLIGVGTPQGEIVAQQLGQRGIARGLTFCIGASIDFLTGVQIRAPRWMQEIGMEWLFRLLQSPRRLARRYLVRGPRVFGILRRIRISLRPTVIPPA